MQGELFPRRTELWGSELVNPKFFHYFYELILFWNGLDNGVPVFWTLEAARAHQMWVREELGDSAAAAAAKSLQSCLTLCDPIDGSPSGSTVPGILHARTLEWVAISFSNVWKWKVKVNSLSRVWLSATPWTAAYQAPPPVGFFRQENWSEVLSPSP